MKNESEMAKRPSFSAFWRQRDMGDSLFINRMTANKASVFIAFIAYKLGATPNQLSIATGISSLCAFGAAVSLPPDWIVPSVVSIYVLSQVSYLFDCADGQLARATGRASDFGDLLDKGIDIAGSFLSFGAFFAYAYRYSIHIGLVEQANYFLLVGFFFILVRTSRFFVWQVFMRSLPKSFQSTKMDDNAIKSVLMNFSEHQFTLFNMLVFLLSPVACLSIFGGQTVIFAAAYFNYFRRAWPNR